MRSASQRRSSSEVAGGFEFCRVVDVVELVDDDDVLEVELVDEVDEVVVVGDADPFCATDDGTVLASKPLLQPESKSTAVHRTIMYLEVL